MTVSTATETIKPKASEVLRGMPREIWIKNEYADGNGGYCSLGYLALQGGVASPCPCSCGQTFNKQDIGEVYGIPDLVLSGVAIINDEEDLDAVIAYLEEKGL